MSEHKRTHRSIPIARTTHGLLQVTAEIGGRSPVLLVDTGAGGTIIDQSAAERFGWIGNPSEEKATGCCETGDVSHVEVESFSLASTELGGRRLCVVDLSHVNRTFEETNERIDGVLGTDILTSREAVIEYSGPHLRLGPPPAEAS